MFGTRPEVVKLAPVLWSLGDAARTIHTGQHYDPALADTLMAELGLAAPSLRLEIGGASRGAQLGEATSQLDRAFAEEPPDIVVVQGDTTSTLAAALAANARRIPLVHVEAGLRSYDRAMPEEHNRVLADHLADLCCAPTETSREQLAAEGITGARVVVTGNTVVDAADRMLPDETQRKALLDRLGLEPDTYVLSTFHRPENVDDESQLRVILDELGALPLPVLLPLHPRTAARLEQSGSRAPGTVRVVEPLGYRDFLALARECAFLVSDSGGVQEEASIVKRPVLVVRASTERPEVLGTFAELVPPGQSIGEHGRAWTRDLAEIHARLASLPTPYGDGHAGERTVAAITGLGA
ncbi:MAG: non-hydrolyzing UDP-N-acetylglucosamine 2-epimerase [Acidimicrobiia bacterium]